MGDMINKVNTIELMAKHEETIAELYSVYAGMFPECDLWPFLYEEEIKHADWVRSILDNVYEGSIEFNDMHLAEKMIEISIHTIRKNKEKAEAGEIDLESALEQAFKLEKSLIEDKYLEYFKSSDEGIQKVLDDLKSDTKSHRDTLRDRRDQYIIEKRSR